MPRTAAPLTGPLAGAVFTRAEGIAAGLSEGRLRGSGVRRVFRGLYADPRLGRRLAVLLRAAARLLPVGGALSGAHAVHLWGLPLPLRRRPATVRAADLIAAGLPREVADERATEAVLLATRLSVAVPADRRLDSRADLDVSELALPPEHVTTRDGIPLLRPARLLLELAANGWRLPDLVALLDAAVRLGLETQETLAAMLRWGVGRRGIRIARRAFSLMDAGAESAMETRLRLLLVLAGLPRPLANIPVQHLGRIVARPDLQYPALRIAVEYDGADHADAVRRARDEQRRVELRALGWVVLTFTSVEVLQHPDVVISRVRAEITRRESGLAAVIQAG